MLPEFEEVSKTKSSKVKTLQKPEEVSEQPNKPKFWRSSKPGPPIFWARFSKNILPKREDVSRKQHLEPVALKTFETLLLLFL